MMQKRALKHPQPQPPTKVIITIRVTCDRGTVTLSHCDRQSVIEHSSFVVVRGMMQKRALKLKNRFLSEVILKISERNDAKTQPPSRKRFCILLWHVTFLPKVKYW